MRLGFDGGSAKPKLTPTDINRYWVTLWSERVNVDDRLGRQHWAHVATVLASIRGSNSFSLPEMHDLLTWYWCWYVPEHQLVERPDNVPDTDPGEWLEFSPRNLFYLTRSFSLWRRNHAFELATESMLTVCRRHVSDPDTLTWTAPEHWRHSV